MYYFLGEGEEAGLLPGVFNRLEVPVPTLLSGVAADMTLPASRLLFGELTVVPPSLVLAFLPFPVLIGRFSKVRARERKGGMYVACPKSKEFKFLTVQSTGFFCVSIGPTR